MRVRNAFSFLIPYRRRRTRRERARVDLDHAVSNAHAVSGELLGERRRRAPIRQSVLIAVPRAGYTAIDNSSLADRPILMGAKIGERPDLRAVAEDRNALPGVTTMRAALSGIESGGPTCNQPSLSQAPVRSPARSRHPATR